MRNQFGISGFRTIFSLIAFGFSIASFTGPSVGAGFASELPIDSASVDPSKSQYSDVQKFIRAVVKQYPKNASLITLGISDSGKPIEGLKIGNGPVHNLVVSTHHGNEYGSTEVAKGFAASIAANPIVGQTVFVIPVLNITGYNAKNREEVAGVDSHDPNRDYPGPCGTSGPHKLKDTALLAKFIDQQGVIASATLHTYYPAVMYPWGISTHDLSTPYDDQFKTLVEAATVESKYQTGNSTAVLYPADGTFEDYAFWKHGIWSLLFELGNSHNPSPADVKEMVNVNVPGLRRMLEQAPRLRAEKHDFTGKCDTKSRSLDRHDE